MSRYMGGKCLTGVPHRMFSYQMCIIFCSENTGSSLQQAAQCVVQTLLLMKILIRGSWQVQWAKHATACAVTEAKARVLEKFREAMEEDYRSASRKSGKPSGTSGGGSSPPSTLFTVEVGSCWPRLGISSGVGRNTSRISSIPLTCLP